MNAVERKRWLQELLIDDVTQGLCGAQQEELDLLLLEDEVMAAEEHDSILRAASAAELAFVVTNHRATKDASGPMPLPMSLESSLKELATKAARGELPGPSSALERRGALVSNDGGATSSVLSFPEPGFPEPGFREPPSEKADVSAGSAYPSSTSSAYLGWWLAAAAAVLAVMGWLPRFVDTPSEPNLVSVSGTPELEAEEPQAARLQLSTSPADYGTVLAMAGTEDQAGAGATGQLLWDEERQQGVMLIRGLAENDRTLFQYQLWIFDARRDERHPVDGGVFDIAPSASRLTDGTVVVPIDARLPVSEATLFAITVEEPGGVVVSERERIVMVASAA